MEGDNDYGSDDNGVITCHISICDKQFIDSGVTEQSAKGFDSVSVIVSDKCVYRSQVSVDWKTDRHLLHSTD